VGTETVLKVYKTLILPIFLYGSENWTLTASQRRRIKAAEIKLLRLLASYNLWLATPSDRLNPLRPQNKQPHTPRIMDYKHTRQDRIQKEMAFTHTKNATKPIPSKTIQLQATRKKNNWMTYEMLDQRVQSFMFMVMNSNR
jgi:hypothetical protein